METELVGTLARLPDGQQVRIEIIYDDGFAKVRRTDGEWTGKVAVCAIEKLELVTQG
jgi:hypothetical protein